MDGCVSGCFVGCLQGCDGRGKKHKYIPVSFGAHPIPPLLRIKRSLNDIILWHFKVCVGVFVFARGALAAVLWTAPSEACHPQLATASAADSPFHIITLTHPTPACHPKGVRFAWLFVGLRIVFLLLHGKGVSQCG